ncbi:hypothetical protein [Acetobacter fallax]|uniref:Uncharacterized protein n=1 Tax=Acetobacter fallax TaxID=1737473 RepID=A0ABX0KA72_9PROT|nr:hypothetical protein [Acetobacter fallax]NHO31738.1 hypothetical protein [Acetobacter fallax]NHO35297.1 hypothetical protein [Acetobacter fallax]
MTDPVSSVSSLPQTLAKDQFVFRMLDSFLPLTRQSEISTSDAGNTAATSAQSSLFVTSDDRRDLDAMADSGTAGISTLATIFSQAAAAINSTTTSDNDKISVWTTVTADIAMFRYGDASTNQIAPAMTAIEQAFYNATQNSPFMKTALAMSEATSLPPNASKLETALYNAAQNIRNSADFTTVTYTDKMNSSTAQTASGTTVNSTFTYGITRENITNVQLVPTFIDPSERSGEKDVITETTSSRQVSATQTGSSGEKSTGSSSSATPAASTYHLFTSGQSTTRTLEQEIAETLLGFGNRTRTNTQA